MSSSDESSQFILCYYSTSYLYTKFCNKIVLNYKYINLIYIKDDHNFFCIGFLQDPVFMYDIIFRTCYCCSICLKQN